jgi:hypothetical protein
MATFERIHWGRILIGGFLTEGALLTFVLANGLFFAQHSFPYATPLASMLACFLFAFWVGQRVDANFVLHGALVGVVATLIEVGLFHGRPEHWAYIAAQALKIPCGAAGGLVAGRVRGLLGNHEEKERIVAAPYKKAFAFACGLLVGAFLFQRFGFDKNGELYGGKRYLGAALLASIGLAGIFPEARPISAIGLGLGPTLVFCIEVVILDPAESMWPVVLPFIFRP